jgi:hypothetical protein
MHARVIFDETGAWEVPPINSLLKGSVDSIHPSQIPREPFETAWQRNDATPLPDHDLDDH